MQPITQTLDSVSIPEQYTLDVDVQALLHEHDHVGDNQLHLAQIQEDLHNDAGIADAVDEKLADVLGSKIDT